MPAGNMAQVKGMVDQRPIDRQFRSSLAILRPTSRLLKNGFGSRY
jgi:hypothetical protein